MNCGVAVSLPSVVDYIVLDSHPIVDPIMGDLETYRMRMRRVIRLKNYF